MKGEGGFVVAPYSMHSMGEQYQWDLHPDEVPLAKLPAWLLERLGRATESLAKAKDSDVDGTIREGVRNNALTSFAGWLRRSGAVPKQIEAILETANEQLCKPLLAEGEVSGIARGMERYPAGVEDPPSSAQPVEYLDLAEYRKKGIPPIDWILPGWLARNDIAILAGAAGIGKSTTAADLAVALATGREWCAIKPTRPVLVLHFDEEQDDATTLRLFARLGAPDDNPKIASCQGIQLNSPDAVKRLEEEIRKHKPELVILDSVQQVFGDIDENSAPQVGAAYRELFRLRDTCQVTFLLLHHKRKANPNHKTDPMELVRGSTAHSTQASTVWFASSCGDGWMNLIQVKRRKAKKQTLRIRYEEDGEDGPIRLSGEGPVVDPDGALEVASKWLRDYLTENGDSKRAAINEAGGAAGHSKATIKRAISHLQEFGVIINVRHGYWALAETRQREVPA